ncbi:IucA/IucC family protein [Streptomyces sp. CBMA29]|uniref:IucA/IucC family protein n=1 Tax=Streptomyces sp. CBMA29 TaxID=1896314 RepID=UPI0016621052|nr:IucA/IucC family siderophore biosynthesis protein [Streptomyces sp. CBMA29]MBD0734992.1 IucA/IucC family protein [Streptomyces sp. CBMA29]
MTDVDHLTPALWERATRHLVAKALAEFAHERLLTPEPSSQDGHDGHDSYLVRSDDGATTYRFAARRLALDHWQIDPASITRHRQAAELPLDALDFITELRTTLAISDSVLPVYLEEISATLSAAAFRRAAHDRTPVSAAELTRAGFQAIETGMTEGHPCFVANSGRLGFGTDDHLRYAPEAASPVRLIWLAARRDRTTFSAGAGIDYEDFLTAELGREQLQRFAAALTGRGLDPAAYLLIPVHPWQWWNKLSVTFAGEVARQHLVCLGPGDDAYLAQQSVRTFFNTTVPTRHYVKTALSVLNMGFMRGLSAAYMAATPAINDWLAELITADPTFAAARFSIIRERAAIGYHHRQYEAATAYGSPYRKMLAALWRESPVADLEPGHRLATMASLLHTDGAGTSFAGALIARSGLPAETWLRRYLDAYLVPVLHSLYAYGLAFMPHGENVILVLDETGAVRRAVFKDIAEEIVIMDPETPLPPEVERIRAEVPEDERVLAVFTDVFDCFFRFLSAILHTGKILDETVFWRTVAECVADYQAAHPDLAERFKRYDLFAPEFTLSCLNRLQLRDNQQMIDLADPSAALQFAGTLPNPLAAHRPRP